jgi:hypothetical protein
MANATTTRERTGTAMGGSVLEALGGIAAVVLACLGLAQIAPMWMAAVSTILVGAALTLEGAAISTRYQEMAVTDRETRDRAQLGSGVTSEVLGGLAGIVLGAIALFDIAPLVLVAVAQIVFGGALMLGSAGAARFHREMLARGTAAKVGRASPGIELMVGIAAITLGILALSGFVPLTLSLVSLLVVGLTVLLSGSIIGARLRRAVPGHAV